MVSMKLRARIEVNLKPGHSDPEGETIKQSLTELNYVVNSVNVSKMYELILEAKNLAEARRQLEEMCKRLLANPVKDNFRFEIEEIK
jgi:phosphoribosylformylglycinamidine synthase PurS subunit